MIERGQTENRLSAERRRRAMASIPRKDTKPELVVRHLLRGLGVGYRLHSKDLAGRPDIVMRGRRKIIFVHGCLWHLHKGCSLARVPKSRPDYWPAKLARNRDRDTRNITQLRRQGWSVAVVWECETLDRKSLETRLRHVLDLTVGTRPPA
jgi:DNA mismatch endonuclease (patch repair protein)